MGIQVVLAGRLGEARQVGEFRNGLRAVLGVILRPFVEVSAHDGAQAGGAFRIFQVIDVEGQDLLFGEVLVELHGQEQLLDLPGRHLIPFPAVEVLVLDQLLVDGGTAPGIVILIHFAADHAVDHVGDPFHGYAGALPEILILDSHDSRLVKFRDLLVSQAYRPLVRRLPDHVPVFVQDLRRFIGLQILGVHRRQGIEPVPDKKHPRQ